MQELIQRRNNGHQLTHLDEKFFKEEKEKKVNYCYENNFGKVNKTKANAEPFTPCRIDGIVERITLIGLKN